MRKHFMKGDLESRLHQLGKKGLPRILLGFTWYAEGIWTGDILVADI